LAPKDSGPANANSAQSCSHPNHPDSLAQVQTTADRPTLPVGNGLWGSLSDANPQAQHQPQLFAVPFDAGQSLDVEDGKVVDWEPIPPSYELAVPADVFFDMPTMAQLWGYSWRERLFLRTLA